ncbi:hypothetical protein ACHAQJ_009137 [Trichoderma viride]
MSGVFRAQTIPGSSKIVASRRAGYHQSRGQRAEKRVGNSRRKERTTSLGKALSEVAAETPHIVVPNAADFATRSIEVRREEATSAGKVKRPLNAFMLYRKSYQNVAKTCCTKNNHQQVSTVCGDSWTNCEPAEVVSEFNRLAIVERQMHEEAFPNYKYDPLHSKKGEDKDMAPSLPQDSSDFGHMIGRASTRENKTKRKKKDLPEYYEPLHSNNERYPQTINEQQLAFLTRPVASHTYWTPPALQAHSTPYYEEQHTYLDPGSFQVHHMWSGEDSLPSRNTRPASHGLYGDTMGHSFHLPELFIDPALLPHQPITVYGLPNGGSHAAQERWHQGPSEMPHTEAMLPGLDMGGSCDAYLRGTESDWKVEQFEEPSQFEDWMSQIDR